MRLPTTAAIRRHLEAKLDHLTAERDRAVEHGANLARIRDLDADIADVTFDLNGLRGGRR